MVSRRREFLRVDPLHVLVHHVGEDRLSEVLWSHPSFAVSSYFEALCLDIGPSKCILA